MWSISIRSEKSVRPEIKIPFTNETEPGEICSFSSGQWHF
jgi:hypothetical protein